MTSNRGVASAFLYFCFLSISGNLYGSMKRIIAVAAKVEGDSPFESTRSHTVLGYASKLEAFAVEVLCFLPARAYVENFNIKRDSPEYIYRTYRK